MEEEDKQDLVAPARLCDSSLNRHMSPMLTRTLIRLGFALTHILFFLGQTRIMWYLFSQVELDFNVRATAVQSQLVFDLLRLPNPVHLNYSMHQVLEEFTYWDAIRGLYTGRTGPPDPLYDQTPGFGGKLSALLLVLFSAIWPHFKLAWLNLEYHRRVERNFDSRTNTLYWLDTFGKWSLADVFVICTLLAVLNLDIPISGDRFLSGVRLQFAAIRKTLENADSVHRASEAICAELLLLTPNTALFAQCERRLERAFPSVALLVRAVDHLLKHCSVDGDLLATIRVKGESGIYFFCIATLCSLALSWAVDVVDHRMRKIRAKLRVDDEYSEIMLEQDSPPSAPAMPVQSFFLPTLPELAQVQQQRSWLLALSLFTALSVCLAAVVPIVERRVPGSVMDLVEADFQVDLRRQYRLYDLAVLTGEAGGWDNVLMTALAAFLLVGPLLRALVLLLLVWLPVPNCGGYGAWLQRRLAFASSSLGVLAGWDVLVVAFVMVTVEMPRITQGIISPKLEICKFLHHLGLAPYCISIEFILLPEFGLLPVAVLVLLVCAARVTRIAYAVYDPYADQYSGAPPCVTGLISM